MNHTELEAALCGLGPEGISAMYGLCGSEDGFICLFNIINERSDIAVSQNFTTALCASSVSRKNDSMVFWLCYYPEAHFCLERLLQKKS